MRHAVAGRKLNRPTGHRLALYRNLATDLLRYEHITTTFAKAKAVQPIVEKLITLGKTDSVHHRRLAAARLYDRKIVQKLFDVIGPRFADRAGGYTRIIRLGRRLGDAAEMARIELVE
ncbi:MAG TPA: 50S ribosomal protein L17 [Chloroflexota bacterium]|nr:50S ribosomal protein L17 [Chloroflexota bacterium]